MNVGKYKSYLVTRLEIPNTRSQWVSYRLFMQRKLRQLRPSDYNECGKLYKPFGYRIGNS